MALDCLLKWKKPFLDPFLGSLVMGRCGRSGREVVEGLESGGGGGCSFKVDEMEGYVEGGSSRVCLKGCCFCFWGEGWSSLLLSIATATAAVVGEGCAVAVAVAVAAAAADDEVPVAVTAARAAVDCDTFRSLTPWFLKGENRLWKGEERGDRGDLESAGDTPGEVVSAADGSPLLLREAAASD